MIVPRIGLSPVRKLPKLYLGAQNIQWIFYLEFLWFSKGWLVRDFRGQAECRHLGEKLTLCGAHALMTLAEWKLWVRTYLPAGGVRGKNILDVGAGCGETCHFFLTHGASKVIAIESSPDCARNLKRNVRRNNWNVDVICEPFRPEHLNQFCFDIMKMDIEGAETNLLSLDSLPKAIIETHDRMTTKSFQKKFGMRPLQNWTRGVSVLSNLDS